MIYNWINEEVRDRKKKVHQFKLDIVVQKEYERLLEDTKDKRDEVAELYGTIPRLYEKMLRGYYIDEILNPLDRMILKGINKIIEGRPSSSIKNVEVKE